ncbi:uncharacterized protein METZ01_LOCUS404055, partial [marine metagenome]
MSQSKEPIGQKQHSIKPPFLIGVRIEGFPKSMLYNPGNHNFRVGTQVIVESDQGPQMGTIASNKIPNIGKVKNKIQRVLRSFNENDLQAQARKNKQEEHAKEICQQIIKKLKLEMSLSRVSLILHERKIVFFFTAEGRVDFRRLIKELVSKLKQRIEMRQVGVRDEASVINGHGICGETL